MSIRRILSRFNKGGFACLTVLLLAACGGSGGGGGEEGTASSSFGNLQVALTDAQNPELNELVLSIREIRAVPAGEEELNDEELPLIAKFNPPFSTNVLDLAFQSELLAEVDMPAEDYSQIRLVVEPNPAFGAPFNYLALADEPEVQIPIKTPSGSESGLKVNGTYEVVAEGTTVVVLDFDPNRAIVQQGNGDWIFKPTGIRMIRLQQELPEYGAIAGTVMQEGVNPEGEPIEVPMGDATVSILEADTGELVATTATDPEDGTFRALVPDGFYRVMVEAEGFLPFDSDPQVFDVMEGEETLLVTVVLAAVAEAPPVLEEVPAGEEPVVEEGPAVEEEPPAEPVERAPVLVRFWLADGSGPELDGGEIVVGRISAHLPGGGWQEIFSGEALIELGALPAEEALLVGELELPAGKITQLRIELLEATVFQAEMEYPLDLPGGELKLNRNMELCAGGEADVVIDLGAGKSLKYNAKKDEFSLKPVPRLAEFTSACTEDEAPAEEPPLADLPVETPPVEEPPAA